MPSVRRRPPRLQELGELDNAGVKHLSQGEWALQSGSAAIRHGKLNATTDTDYLVLTCPQCEAELMGGTGVALLGWRIHNPTFAAVLFELSCACGFVDCFKVPFGRPFTSMRRVKR